MRVLIAEDNVTMASALKYMLQHMGFSYVAEANDGADALSMLARERFDLVVVDWMLPSLSGVAIVNWMRSRQPYFTCPVIMVTVKDQPEDVLVAVESGVDEYILKPLDKSVLQGKIEKLLKANRRKGEA